MPANCVERVGDGEPLGRGIGIGDAVLAIAIAGSPRPWPPRAGSPRNPPSAPRRARWSRYHSSMVNSGWCSGPRSRLRNTRAKLKIRGSPAASSFLQANSGEVCRYIGARPPPGVASSVAKACRWTSLPGRDLQRRRLDLEEAALAEPVPQRRQDAAARQQERPPVGIDIGGPTRGRGRSLVPWACKPIRSRENAGEVGQDQYGAARNRRGGALAPIQHQPRNITCESHRQLRPQGQYARDRRQALRRPDRRKLPSRQGHADHPDRHAPDQRRREDLAALQDHRAGRARPCRGSRRISSSTATAKASTS